jgi:hypothetical protein
MTSLLDRQVVELTQVVFVLLESVPVMRISQTVFHFSTMSSQSPGVSIVSFSF